MQRQPCVRGVRDGQAAEGGAVAAQRTQLDAVGAGEALAGAVQQQQQQGDWGAGEAWEGGRQVLRGVRAGVAVGRRQQGWGCAWEASAGALPLQVPHQHVLALVAVVVVLLRTFLRVLKQREKKGKKKKSITRFVLERKKKEDKNTNRWFLIP